MSKLTNDSVQQLMLVLDRTASNSDQGIRLPTAFHDAVRHVSNRYGVTYQTIGDLCRRRLDLSDVGEFIDLLGRWLEGDGDPLRRQIRKQSNATAHKGLDNFFEKAGAAAGRSVAMNPRAPRADPAPSASSNPPSVEELHLRLRIGPKLARRFRLAHLAGLGSTLEDTAVTLLEKGFDAEKGRVRQALDAAVSAP